MPALLSVDLYGGTGLESFATPPVVIVAGLALLVFGRRIYWLLVAVAGFALGYYLAQRYLELEPGTATFVVAVLAGLLCGAVGVLFQKIAVATVGFVAGGLAMLYVAGSLQWDAGYWVLIAALAGGIAGALLARSLFELALVVFTAIAGAALCVPAIGVAPELEMPLFVGLGAVGVVVQLALARKSAKKS